MLQTSEPQHRKNRLGNVPRSHQQFVPYSKDKIKVAILLPKDLSKTAMILGNLSSADSLVLRIKLNKNLTILLASVYMEFNKDIPSQLLTRLCNFADTEKLPLIIGTDTIAHHSAWGSPDCITRRRNVLQH